MDYGYWGSITRMILSEGTPDQALVIPARAGSGKTTWITALMLEVSRLWFKGDPLAEALGGVLLVFQKVETLNALYQALEGAFPGETSPMVPLQSWSASGKELGYCKNPEVHSNRECKPSLCPYSKECAVLAFHEEKDGAFILGITQARFKLMKRSGELERCLRRRRGEKEVYRRFLICDEKPPLVEEYTLSMTTINKARSELEELIEKRGANDRTIASIQKGLGYCLERPFQQLRTKNDPADSQAPLPFGLCSLAKLSPEERDEYKKLKGRLAKGPGYLTPAVKECLAVMDRLIDGECLYGRTGSFSIFESTPPVVNFEQAVTLIFDATAEVDGDYKHLAGSRMLLPSPTGNFENVQFHIWTDPIFNVSENAMRSAWKIPALVAFTKEEVLTKYPGKTFLCSYKKYAELLAEHLPDLVLRMPREGTSCVPYFGGTNGDNRFNDCTNVVLVGYPRLSPQTYLYRTWAFWRSARIEREIQDALVADVRPNAFLQDLLPTVGQYEQYHLAARLEQELYRSAIRNPGNKQKIHIFMFAPPGGLVDMLQSRFPGCQVDWHEEVPAYVERQKADHRLHKGEKTSYSRLADFIDNWDGSSILVADLKEKLGISSSVWRDLVGSKRIQDLFEYYGITRSGRGGNAALHKAAYANRSTHCNQAISI